MLLCLFPKFILYESETLLTAWCFDSIRFVLGDVNVHLVQMCLNKYDIVIYRCFEDTNGRLVRRHYSSFKHTILNFLEATWTYLLKSCNILVLGEKCPLFKLHLLVLFLPIWTTSLMR